MIRITCPGQFYKWYNNLSKECQQFFAWEKSLVDMVVCPSEYFDEKGFLTPKWSHWGKC